MAFFNIIFTTKCLIVIALFILNQTSNALTVHQCSTNTTFTPNSTYQSNLINLLSNLSTQANLGKDFYQTEQGIGTSVVYGSYLCRGDINATACKDCVDTATKESSTLCPVEKEAVIWYDLCMLRYSNRSYFNIVETYPGYYAWNTVNVTKTDQFRKKLESIMTESAREVQSEAKRFLTKEITLDGFQTIYSLMQCTPDISGSDCTLCLRQAIAGLSICCVGKLGGRVLYPSCNVRYEVYVFHTITEPKVVIPLPPPPVSTIVSPPPPSGISKLAIGSIVLVAVLVTSAFGAYCVVRRRRVRLKKYDVIQRENDAGIEALQYDLLTVETATENFNKKNKLGEGGFGEVYKGILPEGKEIAVKRLSKSSGQGAQEFRNEVALVAKLQHRNLVRLLGFCLGGGETLLVYEFVPNKSLDYFLFDPKKQGLLDWAARCKIISGIARGILYLHEDSRLKVIHRDLKASNILLDEDMNPKVSDFGMAKMVGIDQTEGNTKRIVGTYGYMAPEYAMEGLYSIKSDVFSFGVLLLEIVSGKKNSGFHLTKFAPSLLAYAWQLWHEKKCLDLIDQSLRSSFRANEFVRYVHIGLLCVQEDAYNRPTMSSVVLMLTTETITLPIPERPAFSVGRFVNNHCLQDSAADEISDNGLTISNLESR